MCAAIESRGGEVKRSLLVMKQTIQREYCSLTCMLVNVVLLVWVGELGLFYSENGTGTDVM